jgi:hypothetical protein
MFFDNFNRSREWIRVAPERVNRGETLSEPFSPFESKLGMIHICK